MFPKARGVEADGDVIPHDVTLPAADELHREGSGLAVIGGLTPEVVGVLDFRLELRGFRRLAVVDNGVIGANGGAVFKVAWFGSPIKAATVQSLMKVWVNRTWAMRAVGVPVICNGPSSADSAYHSQNMEKYWPNINSEVGQLNRNMAWRRRGV